MWIDVKDKLPDDLEEVLVNDGDGSCCVGWFRSADETWHASTDLLEAMNYDGHAHIEIDSFQEIKFWQPIEKISNKQMQSDAETPASEIECHCRGDKNCIFCNQPMRR